MSEEQLMATPCVFGENGNFLLERELGRGGMGGVYMGRDKMLDRPVAVKVMLKEYGSDAEFVEKFKREAQAAARLIHPNIAQIYSYGISDGMPYIAMELVAGGSLDRIMANSGANTDVPRIMKICEQVAQALRCAADQGLVHGDVKPENILLDANGNAKLVDFGLAAMQKNTDEIWGTPYYIAPEKVRKEPIDYRADMYSLGGTIYHALTGVAPFEGDDAAAVVRRRFEGAPAKPSEVRPGLSPQIDFLVMKMLEANPADRYPSFEALLEDFKKVMTTGLSSTQSLAAQAGGAAAAAAPKASGGGKRVTIKPRKKIRLSGAASGAAASANADDTGADVPPPPEDEEEEGGVLGKVALVIGGVVAAIALVGGGLWWLKAKSERDSAAEAAAQIERNIAAARASLENTRTVAASYREKIENMADGLAADLRKIKMEVRKNVGGIYPEAVLVMLEPPKTAELVEAEKAFAAPLDAKPEAAPQPEAATDGGAGSPLPAAQPEAAPATPADGAAPATAEAQPAPEAPKLEVPPIVATVGELWEKACAAQAAALRVRRRLAVLDADIAAALAMKPEGEKGMEAVAKAANDCKAQFDAIKGSAEVTTLEKAKGTVKDRGEKALAKLLRKLREDALQKERDEKKRREEEAEKAREEAQAAERKQKVSDETDSARVKFESICQAGSIRQLDWAGAKRQLNAMKEGFETAEGGLEIDRQLRKIDMMESVQKILVRNAKGYEFARGTPKAKDPKAQKPSLRGMTATDADMRTLSVKAKTGGQTRKIAWQTFYRDYSANLGELCNRFILHGRQNGNPKLNLREQADALLGLALTMRFVCAGEASAAAYGEAMAKEAVKAMPDRLELARELFPDIDFSDIEKAAAAERF